MWPEGTVRTFAYPQQREAHNRSDNMIFLEAPRISVPLILQNDDFCCSCFRTDEFHCVRIKE